MGDGGRRDVEFGGGAGEALVASRSLEHRPVRLHIDHAAGARKRRVQRLFRSHVELVYEDAHGSRFVNSAIADSGEFWWVSTTMAAQCGGGSG